MFTSTFLVIKKIQMKIMFSKFVYKYINHLLNSYYSQYIAIDTKEPR